MKKHKNRIRRHEISLNYNTASLQASHRKHKLKLKLLLKKYVTTHTFFIKPIKIFILSSGTHWLLKSGGCEKYHKDREREPNVSQLLSGTDSAKVSNHCHIVRLPL